MLNNEEFFKAFDWDDEIENENEFELLPEGTYNFVVESFTRGEHPGSEKLPPCKKAILGIRCTDDKGHEGVIFHNLFLHHHLNQYLFFDLQYVLFFHHIL